MRDIQKKFYKNLVASLVCCIAVWFMLSSVYESLKGHTMTDYIKNYSTQDDVIASKEDIKYQLIDEGIIEVEDIWIENSRVYYRIKGLNAGETFLIIYDKEGEFLTTEEFEVSGLGIVKEKSSGNYSNCRTHILINTLLMTAIAIIFLGMLIRFNKGLRYSYEMMFVGGLLIWLICTVISQWYAFVRFRGVYYYYTILKQSGYRFILYTAPIVLVFCVSLTISNISLIRHERFRFTNILGIIISAMLFFGSIIAIAISNIDIKADTVQLHVANIAISTFTTAYSVFAALLEGAILGGIIAAKNVPSMDRDYIIILGCMIRKDGSLTPLLRGRVDRAIKHSNQQEEINGKKAIFVPSGGQGSNEVMAEGDAMKAYLLSQGIPEERILVENKSKNTFENMKLSKAIIDEQMADAKIAFSTTNYHVFRSGIIATQNGFMPEGMGSRTKWYFWPNAFIREYIGMMSYTKLAIAIIFAILILGFAAVELLLV